MTNCLRRISFVLAIVFVMQFASGCSHTKPLAGFAVSPYFREQVRSYVYDPDVKVHINAPSIERFDFRKPTRIVLYALPNGNTTAQTIGKQKQEGVDWHFFIQHIGAQVRQLRSVITKEKIVVVYLEAGSRSWPRWRKAHEGSGKLIVELVESIKDQFAGEVSVELAGHSGGGSFIFGFINELEEIPDYVRRIVFLDANYGYSEQHTEKFLRWLGKSDGNHLGVVAYDDRRIKVNGKLVVGPTGGTYRKTHKMLDHLRKRIELTESENSNYYHWQGVEGRLGLIVLKNPDDKILHTVIVEKNGLIHGLTFESPYENQAGTFWGPVSYTQWIQPD